ncbi:MAG: DUF1501 domain-containing protein [Verrucomicrobiales bacterium]|nr:DUF1501 domain-containing protein [Verrucomicrobiales bacterium]
MNIRTSPKSLPGLDRRQFLLRGGCGMMSLTSAVNVISQLKLMQSTLNAQGAGGGYKALVCVFLQGGNDGNNTLIPFSGAARTDYETGRGVLAIPTTGGTSLQNLTATQLTTNPTHIAAADPLGGYLGTFATHPVARQIRGMFNAGEMAFVANVGTLTQPGITRANYATSSRPPQLFSHSDQQQQWQSSVPDMPFTSGWGGRIANLINAGYNGGSQASMSISIAGVNSFQVSPGGSIIPYVMSSDGVVSLSGYGTNYANAVNNPATLFSDANYQANEAGQRLRAFERIIQLSNANLMENGANSVMVNARRVEGVVGDALQPTVSGSGTTLDTHFSNAFAGAETGITANNDFTNQMKLVARLIAGQAALGQQRQIFFVQMGGFDTHTTQIPTTGNVYATGHAGLLNTLDRTLKAFRDSLQALGVWNNVVTFTASDFTRTLTPNKTDSSAGSDHAWGGHAMVMGGPVSGGRIYGKFPPLKLGAVADSIDATGSSGRWIPSTSVDQYAAVLANWFGVPTADLATIFPNLPRFSAAPFTDILTANQTPNLGFLTNV